MLEPPPPPPRHPSIRSNLVRTPSSAPPRPPPSPSLSPAATNQPDPEVRRHTAELDGPATVPTVPVKEAEPTATADDAAPSVRLSDDASASAVPPRHPQTARFASPLPSPHLTSPPPTPPPLRAGGASSAVQRKLRDLEDQETLDLLERVGDQLTDVRLVDADRGDVVYPDREHFRAEDGRLDYLGFALAYLATAALDYTPPGLIGPPPPTAFSFRSLRTDLERLYIICPPPVWQRFLFGTFSSLYRWENPRRTATWAACYLLLWAWDLLLLLPFAVLLYQLVHAHVFPPSTEDLLALASDRRSRTRDAAELGKQLSASNRFGLLAGEGVRGLWSDVRERFSREDLDVASAENVIRVAAEEREGDLLANTTTSISADAPFRTGTISTSRPTSALARGLGSSVGVLGAPAAPLQTQLDELRPPPGARLDVQDPDYDPARGPRGEGDLSLYRLVRHLAGLLGPHAMLWCGEAADVCEMIKNILAHPDHPASRTVALRLALVCATLLVLPAWIVYKTLWLYLGIEIFALWRLRELYPEWRRATIPHWWLLVGAPTDVDYALFVLRQRGLTQRPVHGAKTLRRTARAAAAGESTGSNTGGTRAVARRAGRALLRRAKGGAGEEMLLASGESEAVVGSFFAMHASAPGFLRLSRSTVLFTPSRRLKRLGKLTSRLLGSSAASTTTTTPAADELGGTDEDVDSASMVSGGTDSTAMARAQGEVQIAVEEIAHVKKETRLRALEGLVVTTKAGKVWRFANVARRDDAFNKLLSLSTARWEQT